MIHMAKKYEFKPDKTGNSILSKLYLTAAQRRTILKWSLYAGVLLLLSLLQDVILSKVRLFGATTDLVPCAIILICILEEAHKSAIFTLVAACVFLFSGGAPGPYCLVFVTVLALFASILRQNYLTKRFSSAMVCCLAAYVLYELLTFAMGLFLGHTSFNRIQGFIITILLSLPAFPILYPVCVSIGGKTWKE